MNSVGLRPYVVYGPGRDQGLTSAPTQAMRAAAEGAGFIIPYSGNSEMQFAPDVAAAFIAAARSSHAGATVLNVPGTSASVDEVIVEIERAVPESRGRIESQGPPLPFPKESQLERVSRRRRRGAGDTARRWRCRDDPPFSRRYVDDEHDQRARAVHPLDAIELDVRGRRGARDEGHRPPLDPHDLIEEGNRLGNQLDDLTLLDDAEVEVGHERDRTAPFRGAGAEHDRAGLRDRNRAAREHGVHPVELVGAETRVDDRVDAAGRHPAGSPAGITSRVRRRAAQSSPTTAATSPGPIRRISAR